MREQTDRAVWTVLPSQTIQLLPMHLHSLTWKDFQTQSWYIRQRTVKDYGDQQVRLETRSDLLTIGTSKTEDLFQTCSLLFTLVYERERENSSAPLTNHLDYLY